MHTYFMALTYGTDPLLYSNSGAIHLQSLNVFRPPLSPRSACFGFLQAKIRGGGQKKPIPFPKSQIGFFLGFNLKNAIIILILYLKLKYSVTPTIMLLQINMDEGKL